MMWYLLPGLILGIVLGLNMPWTVPEVLARYLAVSLLAGVDTSLGGLRAAMEGDFDIAVFSSGFIVNAIVSAAFMYIGDILGIELYLAAVVAMGIRVFNNLGIIRRYFLSNLAKRDDDGKISRW